MSKLFILFIKPCKPVSTVTVVSTVSVWSVSVTNTHMHVKGVPVVEILRASYWTNEHTFRKFHLREHIVLE